MLESNPLKPELLVGGLGAHEAKKEYIGLVGLYEAKAEENIVAVVVVVVVKYKLSSSCIYIYIYIYINTYGAI